MPDTSTNLFIRNNMALQHRRNMWSFYGYSVALALIPEQDFNLELVEVIASSSDKADIFLVAIEGSEKFAMALSHLHAIDGLFLTSDVDNWRELSAPTEVALHNLFSNPGDLGSAANLKL